MSWGEGEQLDESRRLPPPPRPVRDGPTPDAHAELAEQLDPKIGHQTLPKAVLLDDRPPVDGRRPFEVRLGSERESDRGDEREEKLSATAFAALVEGRWREARSDFERVQAHGETAEECFGLGVSLRWLGENHARVDRCSRAYALVRQSGDGQARRSARSGWPSPTRRIFANLAAANAWTGGPSGCWSHSRPGRCTAGCRWRALAGWPS